MIIYNKHIPFKGYKAMAVYPFIFARKEYEENGIGEKTLNHEKIHFAQQKELLILGFFLLYLLYWIIYGYKNIPFEKEAYGNSDNFKYLEKRKRNNWINY